MKPIRGRTGDKVKIYQDPITKKKLEGEATLVQFQSANDDGLEDWLVKFPGETETNQRMIQY